MSATRSDEITIDERELPTVDDLVAVLSETVQSYLGGEPVPAPRTESAAPDSPEPGESWSASVDFHGSWVGRVSLEMPASTATLATREMLALEPEETVTDEDVADAVGELVNIVGGSVKSMVAATSTLTVPVVAAGRVALPRSARSLRDGAVEWNGRSLRLHLHALHTTGDADLTGGLS